MIPENAIWQVRTKQNKQGQLHNELIKREKKKKATLRTKHNSKVMNPEGRQEQLMLKKE